MLKHAAAVLPPGWITPRVGEVLALLGDPQGEHVTVTLHLDELEIDIEANCSVASTIHIPLLAILEAIQLDTKKYGS